MPYACIATPLDRNFSIFGGVAQSQTKRCISTTKCVIGLTWVSSMVELINHTSNSTFRKSPIRRVFPNPVTYNMATDLEDWSQTETIATSCTYWYLLHIHVHVIIRKLDHIPSSCIVLMMHMVKVVNIVRTLSTRHIDTSAPQLQRWSLQRISILTVVHISMLRSQEANSIAA